MNTHFKPDRLLLPDEATDHILGSTSAPATLVEYGDFECPSCVQACAALQTMLPHSGSRLCFVFRHFPLREVHPHAELAAEAAEAAGAQGKFWEMHGLLYTLSPHLKEKHLLDYAGQLELDLPRFHNALNDHVYLQRVQEHVQGGQRLGIRSTPAFYVNGMLIDVSIGLQPLEQAIDKALRQK